jgi:hypothetical protein
VRHEGKKNASLDRSLFTGQQIKTGSLHKKMVILLFLLGIGDFKKRR